MIKFVKIIEKKLGNFFDFSQIKMSKMSMHTALHSTIGLNYIHK
jgi:hypothetical protein